MLDLLTIPNDDAGFIIDRVRAETTSVRLVQVSTLPPKYLPKPSAKHDESLRPEWDQTHQSFLIDTKWDAKLLSDLEKHYLTVYAFNYFTDTQSTKLPPSAMHTYVLDGGFAYLALFRTMRQSVPKNDNARSVAMAAASPGVLTIAAPTTIADQLVRALAAAAKDYTRKAYETLHAWSRLSPKRVAEIPTSAIRDLRLLCEYLHVDMAKLLPAVPADDLSQAQILRAGKVVAAYCRALWRLLTPSWEGVEFLAPARVREEGAQLSFAVADDEDYEDEEDEFYDDEDDA
jgi:hypothetical protein